nr:MAG TPA: hypothetical protein [Caudoviricetes sp.]
MNCLAIVQERLIFEPRSDFLYNDDNLRENKRNASTGKFPAFKPYVKNANVSNYTIYIKNDA